MLRTSTSSGRTSKQTPSRFKDLTAQHAQNMKQFSQSEFIQSSVELLDPHFCDPRFNREDVEEETENAPVEWRIVTRMKTSHVALILALNIGVDPPNVIKTKPCAEDECWTNPFDKPANESLRLIGKNLQAQYERWQPRARYRQCLDPTLEEIQKTCKSMRRNAKRERILFHYNGHGVPFPTNNNEIWVFNKNYTQYIPLALLDLDSWIGSPAIYVFDCSRAGILSDWFGRYTVRKPIRKNREANVKISNEGDEPPRDVIVLSACGSRELLPTNPNLPADLFTACLTTPIKMALRWFCIRTAITGIDMDMIDTIPGTISDRRTPLGELNWIFTAITDTIAWNVLPPKLFQKLFRQDLLVASLMRNYLLAERILHAHDCTPSSIPKLPPTHQHPLWRAWDLAADICLSQLPTLIKNPKLFKPNSFFNDQLTAFEIWLEFASQKESRPPEQLPIVLQVLLSKLHRYRALELLARFLDLGSWAVKYALSVGIFPYVLKLLQSPVPELRKILVKIWARILALDSSCQVDLLKDSGHIHFASYLTQIHIGAEQRAKSAFILSCIVNGHRQGQAACLNQGLLETCTTVLGDSDPIIRRWAILCIGKLWEDYNEAKRVAIKHNVHERLCLLLTDPVPEVRIAAIYSLGTFIGDAADDEARQQIENNLCLTLFVVIADMSPFARIELIISLSRLIFSRPQPFLEVVIEMAKDEFKNQKEIEARKRGDKRRFLTSSNPSLRVQPKTSSQFQGSVCGSIWKFILSLRNDPFPSCSALAKKLIRCIYAEAASALTPKVETDPTLIPLLSYLHRRSQQQPTRPSTPTTPRRSQLFNPLLRRESFQRRGSTGIDITPQSSDDKIEFSPKSFPSTFYQWSYNVFDNSSQDDFDETSAEAMERDWRLRTETKYLDAIRNGKQPSKMKKFDTQMALMNDNQTDVAALIKIHPTEPVLVVADDKKTISIWNWEESRKLQNIDNNNPSNSRISCLELVNTQDQFLILAASSEGIVRVWKNISSDSSPRLVTAWRALSESNSSHNIRTSGLIFDWNQRTGHLIAAGKSSIMRIWDVERELSVQDIHTGTEGTCITSLNHQRGNSENSIVIAGCGDGSLKLFDVRVSQKSGVIAELDSHKAWILNTPMPERNIHTFASGDVSGEVKFWDCRATQSPTAAYTIHKGDMTAFAVHDYADVFCTGTQNQRIRLASIRDGKEINTIRYHDGLILGQRIGPICCLAFHPYRTILAAGATDSIISMYRTGSF